MVLSLDFLTKVARSSICLLPWSDMSVRKVDRGGYPLVKSYMEEFVFSFMGIPHII